MKNQPFTFSGSPDRGVLSGGLLAINGGNILIRGNTLENVTKVGNSHGRIYSIELRVLDIPIPYAYQVVMNGMADYIGGNWYFAFTDEEPDTYTLSVLNPFTANHTVGFNSVAPNIVEIRWAKTP